MEEAERSMNLWIPQEGQVVRLKRGFDRSMTAIALRRASEEGGSRINVSENRRYEVVRYSQDADHRSITVCELTDTGEKHEIHVAGHHHVSLKYKRGEPITLDYNLFELIERQ